MRWQVEASEASAMDVGVNYPWFDYGWDFGEAPPGWGRAAGGEPRWRDRIDDHLERFVALGLRVVRWFILADGLAYGTGPAAPRRIGGWPAPAWRFTPPPLDPTLQAHFALLLERFEAARRGRAAPPITLLPVLVDYPFFQAGRWPVRQRSDGAPPGPDPGWVKGGRADAVNDAGKRRAFLAGALAPLLRIARPHARVIHAWEVVNEPEWVTRGWHPRARRRLPVEASAMRAFVEEASAEIRAAGFRPTVGFARRETLAGTGLLGQLNQFHHYADGRRRLDPPDPPAFLGELATAAADAWPELGPTGQRVLHRLRHAERQGYPLALLWCAAPLVSGAPGDRHARWDAEVEDDVASFTRGRADRLA